MKTPKILRAAPAADPTTAPTTATATGTGADDRTARRAVRRAVLALFAVAAGTNVPTPLLLVYRDSLDLGPDVLTAVFGVYAAGLVPALLVAGPLSDRIGRRRVVLPMMAMSGLVSLLLIAANSSLAVLFVGRLLQGAVSGAMFGVCNAWVAELSAVAGPRPGRSARAGARPAEAGTAASTAGAAGRRSAVAMTAGFSLGPLTSGLLAQYAPGPTTLPYLVHVVVVVSALVATRSLPETVQRRTRGSSAKGPLVLPEHRRTLLTVLLPLSVCVYAFPSVVIAAVPLLVRTTAPPVLLTGVLAGLTLGAGALAAPLQRRLGRWTAVVATAAGSAGYLFAVLGAGSGSPPLLLAAALLLGSGSGLALSSGLGLTARLSQEGRRGSLSAVFLGTAYVGFSAPFLTAILAEATEVQVPLAVAASLTTALCLRLILATRDARTPWETGRTSQVRLASSQAH